jgi:hypothetical protein
MRKIVYPVLHWIKKKEWIDILERKPFELMGSTIQFYTQEKISERGFRQVIDKVVHIF